MAGEMSREEALREMADRRRTREDYGELADKIAGAGKAWTAGGGERARLTTATRAQPTRTSFCRSARAAGRTATWPRPTICCGMVCQPRPPKRHAAHTRSSGAPARGNARRGHVPHHRGPHQGAAGQDDPAERPGTFPSRILPPLAQRAVTRAFPARHARSCPLKGFCMKCASRFRPRRRPTTAASA